LQLFAEHLRVNPRFDGRLIIYNDSKKRAKAVIKLIANGRAVRAPTKKSRFTENR